MGFVLLLWNAGCLRLPGSTRLQRVSVNMNKLERLNPVWTELQSLRSEISNIQSSGGTALVNAPTINALPLLQPDTTIPGHLSRLELERARVVVNQRVNRLKTELRSRDQFVLQQMEAQLERQLKQRLAELEAEHSRRLEANRLAKLTAEQKLEDHYREILLPIQLKELALRTQARALFGPLKLKAIQEHRSTQAQIEKIIQRENADIAALTAKETAGIDEQYRQAVKQADQNETFSVRETRSLLQSRRASEEKQLEENLHEDLPHAQPAPPALPVKRVGRIVQMVKDQYRSNETRGYQSSQAALSDSIMKMNQSALALNQYIVTETMKQLSVLASQRHWEIVPPGKGSRDVTSIAALWLKSRWANDAKDGSSQ